MEGDGGGLEIVFEIACGRGAFGRGAEIEKPLTYGVGLHVDGIEGRQDGTEEPAGALVSRKCAVGNAAVDESEGGAGAFDLAEEIGPDFSFGDDGYGWAEGAEDTAYGKDIVYGRVENAVGEAYKLLAGGGVSGEGGGGDKQGRERKIAAQAADEFQARQDFADGNCVQPDGAGAGLSKRAR